MTIYMVTKTKEALDEEAARELVQASPAAEEDHWLSTIAEDMIEGLMAIETKKPASLDIMWGLTVDGVDRWAYLYMDGVGDSDCSLCDVEVIEKKIPGLLATIGVRVDVSDGHYGAHRISLP